MSAPARNSSRLRISPKRAASLNAAAGLLMLVFAMMSRFSAREESSGLDLAARGLDGGARTLGGGHALERHRLLDLARQHHLGALCARWHYARLEERLEIDDRRIDLGEFVQPHLGARALDVGAKADLGHTALQRHLPALEPHLVVAALARTLALGATAAGLALSGGSAAADPQSRAAAAGRGLECVQSHIQASLSTRSRCAAVWIMPRFSRVSFTVTVWCLRLRPSPRAEAAMFFSWPLRLFTRVTFSCCSAM